MFSTPVLFLLFNRPQVTAHVFDEIRKQKPKYLFIAADGPRENNINDARFCVETRAVVSKIDWDCEVKTLFSDENMGCGKAVAAGITWFFEHVEAGIILEDDCMPNSSFFTYCEAMLNTFRDNQEVMMVCGTSYQPKPLNSDSYYFSRYPHVWGWATWKRAWAQYDLSLGAVSVEKRAAVINRVFANKRERRFWENNLDMIVNGLDTWDYQWMYWIWENNGVCIIPWRNMIANIGFGADSSHTHDENSGQSKMTQYEMLTIRHPKTIAVNQKADSYERHKILIGSAQKYYYTRMRGFVGRVIKLLIKRHGK